MKPLLQTASHATKGVRTQHPRRRILLSYSRASETPQQQCLTRTLTNNCNNDISEGRLDPARQLASLTAPETRPACEAYTHARPTAPGPATPKQIYTDDRPGSCMQRWQQPWQQQWQQLGLVAETNKTKGKTLSACQQRSCNKHHHKQGLMQGSGERPMPSLSVYVSSQ